MAITLLQSGRGNSVSLTGTSPYTVGTATYTLPQTTQAGSLLVVHTAGITNSHTTGQYQSVNVAISLLGTSGWSAPAGNSWKEATLTTGGSSGINYVANAASISSGTVLSVTFSIPGSGFVYDATGEIAFYEFAGVATSNPVDTAKSINPANPGIPTQNNLTTTATDLVIVGYSGSDSNSTAGTGYTLGVQMQSAVFSEYQYILNQAPGTFTTIFGSGSQTHFGAYAAAFKQGVAAPTITPQVVPSAINAGQSAILSWTSTNATTVTIDNGIGSVATNGSMIVNPTVTTTYNFTANGPGGQALGQATLAINPSICNFDLQKMILSVKESNIPVRGRNQ